MDEIFQEPFLCLPLAVGARWLPTRPDRPEPTSDPKEKVGGAALVVHSMGKRKREWSRGSVWWRTMWDGGCLYYPQVELVSPCLPSVGLGDRLARWPSWASGTQGRPKERVGWWAVGLDWSRGPKEEQYYGGGDALGSRIGWSAPSVCCLRCCRCCYACCYSRGSRPVIALSRPVYVAIAPPEIQEVRKARGERALWRVLTRADLSSQIEAPVGVEPTMADLQFLAHHARDVLRIASPASLTGLLLFLLLCSCGRRHRTT